MAFFLSLLITNIEMLGCLNAEPAWHLEQALLITYSYFYSLLGFSLLVLYSGLLHCKIYDRCGSVFLCYHLWDQSDISAINQAEGRSSCSLCWGKMVFVPWLVATVSPETTSTLNSLLLISVIILWLYNKHWADRIVRIVRLS